MNVEDKLVELGLTEIQQQSLLTLFHKREREAANGAWHEGYTVGWDECKDPEPFQNDSWDSKTISPYSDLNSNPTEQE